MSHVFNSRNIGILQHWRLPETLKLAKELIAMTDWNKEAEQLGSSNFWKPETGQYRVKFLDNGMPPST